MSTESHRQMTQRAWTPADTMSDFIGGTPQREQILKF
jgi:hypothetical protein